MRSGVDHTILPTNTPHLPLPRSSPEGATTERTVIAQANEAYYSLIDPVRMKGWVGLVGWSIQRTVDQWLPISCRSGEDQWKFAGQRPTPVLYYANVIATLFLDLLQWSVNFARVHLFLFVCFCFNKNTGAQCTAGDSLPVNSTCYIKLHNYGYWFDASSDCLSRGGSLAVFADIGHPSANRPLVDWLSTSGTDKSYWIGLVRPWWQTTNAGDGFLAYVFF